MKKQDDDILDSLINIEVEVPKQYLTMTELKHDTPPLILLPVDTLADVTYPQFNEARCAICNSPFRERAEHVYLENGRKPQAVYNFFIRHFNVKMNWVQINTHMEQHCDFKRVASSGLKNYESKEELIAPWIFREHQLALTALLTELDDIRGMDCTKNNELKLKRAAMVERLISKILDLKEKRDNSGLLSFNIFEILMKLHDQFDSDYDKKLVRDEIVKMRQKLQNDQ